MQMRLTQEYEFDWKFYAVALLIIALLVTGFVIGKRVIMQAQGRDVQELLNKTNLADIEASRNSARRYVRRLAQEHNLTRSERDKAEDIYTRYFHEHTNIWIEDRIQGRSEAHTHRRYSECRQRHEEEFQQLLKERR